MRYDLAFGAALWIVVAIVLGKNLAKLAPLRDAYPARRTEYGKP